MHSNTNSSSVVNADALINIGSVWVVEELAFMWVPEGGNEGLWEEGEEVHGCYRWVVRCGKFSMNYV